MGEVILQTRGITKAFDGVKAVNDLSIKFERGKVTSLIGPNGSGKTTLMNLLSGVLPVTSGTVVVSDVEIERVVPFEVKEYGITRTFQNVRLFEQMSVLDNVLLALTRRNVVSAVFERYQQLHENQARDILKHVGLWDKRDEEAGSLSYGQRKLLEIARVLAMVEVGADIVLLDEPFAGLFPEMVKTVEKTIEKLKQEGKTIILIEHNMSIIRKLSDYVFVLDAGKLLAEGTAEEVLEKPEVIEAYLGE